MKQKGKILPAKTGRAVHKAREGRHVDRGLDQQNAPGRGEDGSTLMKAER